MTTQQEQPTDQALDCSTVVPMLQWVKETPETEEFCPPCLIAPLTAYYIESLKRAGEIDLAQTLQKKAASKKVTPKQLANLLDKIKKEVSISIKNELLGFDCIAQHFDPHEEGENG